MTSGPALSAVVGYGPGPGNGNTDPGKRNVRQRMSSDSSAWEPLSGVRTSASHVSSIQ